MKQLLVSFLLLTCAKSVAQEVVVKSFEYLQTDLTARTKEKLDANGNSCALVKVGIPLEDVLFKGWVVETVSTPGEYLVYMPEGATKITMQHKSFTPYTYVFDKPLVGKQTYRMLCAINTEGKVKPVYKVIDVSNEIIDLYNKGIEALEKKEYEEAKRLISEAAEAGYAPAQNELGNMSDDKGALFWYQKAAAQGLPQSIFNIGNIYKLGMGVQRDMEKAFQYYMEAADLDYPLALLTVGHCYVNGEGVPADDGKAVWYYKKSAELNNPEAQLQVAISYLNGIGTKMDKKGGIEWLMKSADQGFASAQGCLGNCYLSGDGVEENGEKAFLWYQKAANQGDITGEIGMGLCYDQGIGVNVDIKTAIFWYEKAAKKGNAVGQTNLGACYWTEAENGTVKNYENAVYWYQKAAEQGYAEAQCRLGSCYDQGKGVPQDKTKAKYWYKKAADQGHVQARLLLSLSN